MPESAAIGAAILAGLGSGAMSSLRAAVGQLVKFDRTFEPDAKARAYYDDKFARYCALYASLAPFNAAYEAER